MQDNYIPLDEIKEAKSFFEELKGDVEIYKQFSKLENFPPDVEADKFAAWWEVTGCLEHPDSLWVLYENIEAITSEIGNYDLVEGYYQLRMKLILMYRLLKEKGLIDG